MICRIVCFARTFLQKDFALPICSLVSRSITKLSPKSLSGSWNHKSYVIIYAMDYRQATRQIHWRWILTWVTLYLTILALGNLLPDSQITTFVRLTGIVLCFLYVVIYFSHDYWLLLAMGATCVADLILAGNNISPLGVTVFVSTQIFHLLHLLTLRNSPTKRYVFIYIAIAICLIVLDVLFDIMPRLYLVCGLYAILLITNIILSYRYRKAEPTNPKAWFAFFGFLLFASCDFCTSMSYFSLIGLLPASFYNLANFLVWFFYYPSQILLSNTGKYDIMTAKEGKN